MNKLLAIILLLIPTCASAQVQLYNLAPADTLNTGDSLPSYENYVPVTELDTIGIDDYLPVYKRLSDDPFFVKDDSLCVVIFEGLDTSCQKVDTVTVMNDFLDTYIDSARFDSDTLYLYRADTSGALVDSFKLYIPTGGTDDQTLSINGHDLSIEDGNTVALPDTVDPDTDVDSLKIENDTLKLWEDDTYLFADFTGFDTDSQNIHIEHKQMDIWLSRSEDTVRVPSPWAYNFDTSHQPLLLDIPSQILQEVFRTGVTQIGSSERHDGEWFTVNRPGSGLSGSPVAVFDNGVGDNEAFIRIQNDSLSWSIGNHDLTRNFQINRNVPSDVTLFTIDTIGQVSLHSYDIDPFPNLKLPDTVNTNAVIVVDGASRLWWTDNLGRDFDLVKLDGDTALTLADTLIPRDSADLHELVWRGGPLRLNDTLFNTPYAPQYHFAPNDSTTALQIEGSLHAIDMYHPSYVYAWWRNNKTDVYWRVHNQDVAEDTIPGYFEVGITSWFDSLGTANPRDTAQRNPFRISTHSNHNALVFERDSLKLGDYLPDRNDGKVADITSMYYPGADGFLRVAPLDSINAALSIAVSADSVGTTGLANEIPYRIGGRGVESEPGFEYNPTTNDLKAPGDTYLANEESAILGTAQVHVGYDRTADGDANLSLHADQDNTADLELIAGGNVQIVNGTTGTFSLRSSSAGIFLHVGSHQNLINTTGQWQWPAYTAASSFPITETALLGVNSSGVVGTIDLSDYATPTGTANTVAYFDASGDLTSETGFNYTEASDLLEVGDLTIGGTTGDALIIESAGRDWQFRTASTTLFMEPEIADVTWWWRDVADANIMIISTGNKEADYYGNWQFQSGLRDASGSLGISGQVLSSTATATSWINVDTDATNEIQNIDLLTITSGATGGLLSSSLSSDATTATVDIEEAVEDITGANILSGTGITALYSDAAGTIQLTNTGVITEVDGSTTNEINVIGQSGTSITLTNGGGSTNINEMVEDIVGGMVSGNTETDITVTYQDGDGTLDFVVSGGAADGDGIYDDNGTIFATKSTINTTWEIATGTGDQFLVDYSDNGIGELNIRSSGTDLNAPSSNSVKIGNTSNTSDQLEVDATSSQVTLNHEGQTSSRIYFYDSGSIEVDAGGTGDDVEIDADDIIQLRATEILATAATGEFQLTSGTEMWVGYASNQSSAVLEVNGEGYKPVGASWTNTSDRRIKEQINPITDAYDRILEMNPVTFHYRADWRQRSNTPDSLQYGYIAQEYQKVFPQDVREGIEYFPGEEPLLELTTNAVGPYTLAAVKQLIKDKESLEKRIEALEAQLIKPAGLSTPIDKEGFKINIEIEKQ